MTKLISDERIKKMSQAPRKTEDIIHYALEEQREGIADYLDDGAGLLGMSRQELSVLKLAAKQLRNSHE